MLNQAQLDTTGFTAKTSLRHILQCINYTDTHTIATDSYKLIQVENTKENIADFPINSNTQLQCNDKPCLIPASLASAIKLPKKTPLSILRTACTHVENDFVSLNATNLETWQTPQARCVVGKFPDITPVMPTPEALAKGYKIRLRAENLLALAKWANKHAENNTIDIIIQGDTMAPFYFEGNTKDNQKFNGLLMPCRQN
jgi:hypothetical protein